MQSEEEKRQKAREYARKYRERNLEKIRASQRKYYADHPEKYALYVERTKKSRELHPETAEKYRSANRERNRLRENRRFHENREEILLKMRVKGKGITVDELVNMLSVQKNCEVCGLEFGTEKVNKPHIDHDHKTGQTRGLVCTNCNLMLGHAKDDPDRLQAAIDYLDRNAPVRYYG